MRKFIALAGLILVGIGSGEAQAGEPCRVIGDSCWYREGDRVEYVNRSNLVVITGDSVEDVKSKRFYRIDELIAPRNIAPLCENERKAGEKAVQHLRDLLMMDPNNQMIKVVFRSYDKEGNSVLARLENRYGSLADQMILDNQGIELPKGLSPSEARRINWCGGSN